MFSRRLARPLGAFAKEWTCPSCVRLSSSRNHQLPLTLHPFQTRASVSQQISHRAFSRTARRNIRPLPESAFDERFQDAGVPRRLPSGEVTQKTEEHLFDTVGYRLAWTEYQKRTLQKLDELLAGEPEENDDIKALVLKFARDPMSASVFNHASMAFNNHFFFQSFSTDLQPLDKYALLEASLAQTFGSIDTLKTTFLDTAAAMFAPGFVWLVWCQGLPSPLANADTTKRGSWRILTTYAAGTPFPEAGYRAQGIDANNSSPESYGAYQATNSLGAFGSLSKSGKDNAKIPPGGTSVVPVLCVSTWEHSYIYNYGYDKRTYLSRWWDAIDWYRVEARFPEEARQTVAKSSLTYEK